MAVTNTFSSVDVSKNELSIWDDTGDIQCSQPVTSIAWKTKIPDQADYFLNGNARTIYYKTDLLINCFTSTLTLTYQRNGLAAI